MGYLRGVDRLDGELITDAFHADAEFVHGSFVMTGHEIADEVIRAAKRLFSGATMHFVGNELIRVSGDTASSEAYFVAFGERDKDGATVFAWRGGRYLDAWECRDGEWRIAKREILSEWDRVDPFVDRWPGATTFMKGIRSHEDGSYNFLPSPGS